MRYLLFILLFVASFIANATNFYIKNESGCDNAAAGTSDATAWCSLTKTLRATLTSTDDLYFKCDNSWDQRIYFATSGVDAANKFKLSSYYMSGTEQIGACDTGQSKPIFRGGYTSVADIDSDPNVYDSGQIQIEANFLAVSNLRVENALGYGITVSATYDNVDISDNEIVKTVSGCILTNAYSNNNTITDNYCNKIAWAEVENAKPYPTHPGCITVRGTNNTVTGNYVLDGSCEAYAIYGGASSNTVANNVAIGAVYIGVYVDNAWSNVIDSNLIIGEGESVTTITKKGLSSSVEGSYSTLYSNYDNTFKNNIVVNVQRGFYSDIENPAQTAGKTNQFDLLNNTFVGADSGIFLEQAGTYYAATSEIKNNIFYEIVAANPCDAPTTANIVFSNNWWDEVTPTDSDCTDAADLTGNPDFNYVGSFLDFNYANMPSAEDVTPKATSNADGAGVAHASVTVDYNDTAKETPPDIGALNTSTASAATLETVPFYMDVGGTGATCESKTYETEQYRVADVSVYSWTSSTATAIANTDCDAIFQTWRGKAGVIQYEIPIDCSGGCDVTIAFNEQYWGDEAGTCTGGERTINADVEGTTANNIDICANTQSANYAYKKTFPSITTGADDVLNITLSPGSTGDTTVELVGIEIVTAAPTGDTLTGNTTGAKTLVNNYPESSLFDAAQVCGVATTAPLGVVYAKSITDNTTYGAAVISSGSIIGYTPDNATRDDPGGTVVVVLSDDVDAADITCTITLTLQLIPKTHVDFKSGGVAVANRTDIGWIFYSCAGLTDLECTYADLLTLPSVASSASDATSDANGRVLIQDSRLPVATTGWLVVFTKNAPKTKNSYWAMLTTY